MSDVRYFNFPVVLLQDFMTDSSTVLKNIIDYSLFAYSQGLKYGNDHSRLMHTVQYFKLPVTLVESAFYNGRKLYESFSKKAPMTGIKQTMYWDFCNNPKSDYEKICLLGFLALKSIIGKKPYCKVDNKFWLSRMDGSAKSKDIESLTEPIRAFSSEYFAKKIKTELENNWGLKTYSRYTRGFYVSFDMKLEALVAEAEMRRKAVKVKQRRDAKNAIVAKVLERIHGTSVTQPAVTPSIRKIGGISVGQARNLLSK